MTPTTAIITRTRNRPIFLRRVLESVQQQTLDNLVHIVINDGGDPTQVERIVGAEKRRSEVAVEIIHNETSIGRENAVNPGFERALQLGAAFVTVLDDDDTISPNSLRARCEYLDAHPNMIAVACDAEIVHERVENDQIIEERREPWQGSPNGITLTELLQHNIMPPASVLLRAEALRTVSGWRGDFSVLGDWDFMVRLAAQGEIGSLREPLAQWHWRESLDEFEGNSIVVDSENHHLAVNRIRDTYIRELVRQASPTAGLDPDVPNGGQGLGIPMLIGGVVDEMSTNVDQGLGEMRSSFAGLHQALHAVDVANSDRTGNASAELLARLAQTNVLIEHLTETVAQQNERFGEISDQLKSMEQRSASQSWWHTIRKPRSER